MSVPEEALEAAHESVRAGYGVMADVMAGQIRYALEAAAPHIAAAERERIRQLALSTVAADPVGASLEDFAGLITQGVA